MDVDSATISAVPPARTHGVKRAKRALSIMKAGSGWVPDESAARSLFGADVAAELSLSGALNATHVADTETSHIPRGVRVEPNLHSAEWRTTETTPWFAPTLTLCDRVKEGEPARQVGQLRRPTTLQGVLRTPLTPLGIARGATLARSVLGLMRVKGVRRTPCATRFC